MKKLVWLAIVLFSILSVRAQNEYNLAVDKQYPGDSAAVKEYQTAVEKQVNQSSAVRTTWVANRPGSNWFFSLEGGLAWLGSENYALVDFKDNLFPTGGFSVGKWFSPVWGLRLNATGSKMKGYANTMNGTWYAGQEYVKTDGYKSPDSYIRGNTQTDRDFIAHQFLGDLKEPYKKGGYRYDVTYAGATLDFLLNLQNLFGQYDPETFFNPVIHTGLGYVHTFKRNGKSVNSYMGKVGLQLNFRLSDQWGLYMDGETLLLPESFDFQLGGDRVHDVVINAKVGITYRFNFRHFIKAPLYDQNFSCGDSTIRWK